VQQDDIITGVRHKNSEHTEYDKDNISIENESPKDSYITINDLNTIEQMNMVQINTDPETRDDLPETN